MLYFKKSTPAPTCLETEKKKANGSHSCGDVLERLQKDFKSKCYICESSQMDTVNVEHFKPHRSDKDLRFDWDNLFWACGHCNNIKHAKAIYDDILDCTNIDHKVEDKVKYDIAPWVKERPVIVANDKSVTTRNTVHLLQMVFNAEAENSEGVTNFATVQQKLQCANLRSKLLTEMRKFKNLLDDYEEMGGEWFTNQVRYHLSKSSDFASFKRWVIRNNSERLAEFGRYLTD